MGGGPGLGSVNGQTFLAIAAMIAFDPLAASSLHCPLQSDRGRSIDGTLAFSPW